MKNRKSYTLRLITAITISVLPIFAKSQKVEGVDLIRFKKCTIQEDHLKTDAIYNISCTSRNIKILAETDVQLSCRYMGENEQGNVTNVLSISLYPDSTGRLRDSLLAEIDTYFNKMEAWSTTYQTGTNFHNLPFYKSFFTSDSTIIPSIWSGSENKGSFYLFYLNHTLIRVELLEANGMGSLTSFVYQNMDLITHQKTIILSNYEKDLEKARSILKSYRDQ